MKIALVGSGNIATFFAGKFHAHGHEIIQVISNRLDRARLLAEPYHAEAGDQLDDLSQQAGVVILAVKDDVLSQILQHQALQNRILIHTAGSVNLDLLLSVTPHAGSLWCVYSVNRHHLPTRPDVPVILNASDPETLKITKQLAACITDHYYYLSDEQKTIAHLGAVFANNFSNFLFTASQDILQKNDLPFELLLPLIENTVEKLQYSRPDKLQTGPAIRHDEQTMEKHRTMLGSEPALLEVYNLISRLIQQKYPQQHG